MQAAEQSSDSKNRQDGNRRSDVHLDEQDGKENAEESEHGTHRKVDAAGDDHHGCADAEDAVHPDQAREIGKVGAAQEEMILIPNGRAHDEKEDEDAELSSKLSRHCPPPVA